MSGAAFFLRLSRLRAELSHLGAVFLRRILRDARLWRAPQDEVLFCGEILDPHGEERRSRRVSNHEAEHAAGPYAIALP